MTPARRMAAGFLAWTLLFTASAWADWTATGRFLYTDRTYDGVTGFIGTLTRPVREADVEIYDLNTLAVLGTGATDQNGDFSIAIADALTRNVAVRVLASTGRTATLNFQVVDTLNANAVYLYHDAGADVASHTSAADLNFGVMTMPAAIGVVAATDWSSQVFNTFDMALLAADWIASVDGSRPAPLLTINWNPTQGRGGSFYSGGSNNLSLADDDGYDDPNILHEIGHYIEDEFGQTRNTGGIHFLGDDDQDRRLSWSEGLATFFSNATLRLHGRPRPDVYSDRDSFGANGTGGGFDYSLEAQVTGGATNERAVNAALYDMIDDAATADASPGADDDTLSGQDANIWTVIEQMDLRNLPATSLEDFWDIWFELALGSQAAMESVFAGHSIDFQPDAQEPNDAPETATALAVGGGFLENTFYKSGVRAGGDEDWFRFTAVAGTTYRITVNGAGNSIFGRPDPEMSLLSASVFEVLATNDDPLDTVLNFADAIPPGSASSADMAESAPSILWRATAGGDIFIYLRHASYRRNILGRYGTYQVSVAAVAAPTPTVATVALQTMLPGQSYRALVIGADIAAGATATTSDAGITVGSIDWIAEQALAIRLDVDGGVAPGSYDLTITNPGGGMTTASGSLPVSAAAQPPLLITEIDFDVPDFVEVRNMGTVAATLTGWRLIGDAADTYLFPAAYSLPAGATVVVSDGPGVDTATEKFDSSGFNWNWDYARTGAISLIDNAGGAVDHIRFISRPVTTHTAPVGAGAAWMQPEIRTPNAPFTLSRSESAGLARTRLGLSPAQSTMPAGGGSGRVNAVDPWEENDEIRIAPLINTGAPITGLAISPRPSGADVDWFGLPLQAGDELTIRAIFTHASGDLDMEIFAPGEESTPLLASLSNTDDEEVTLTSALTTASGGGIYRLRVFGDGGATNGYALQFDVMLGPGVTVEQAATQPDPTRDLPILFDVLFDEAVTDFNDPGDVLFGGTASGVTFNINPVSASAYQIVVTGVAGDGTVIPTIPSAAAQNASMAGNRASTSLDNVVTFDAAAPALSLVGVLTATEMNVFFTEDLAAGANDPANYAISGAGRGTFALNPDTVTTISASVYRLTWLTGEMLDGADVTITAANVQDAAGNPIAAANVATDAAGGIGVLPVVTAAAVQPDGRVLVSFSEDLAAPSLSDPSLYTVSGSGRGTLLANPDLATPAGADAAMLQWNFNEMLDGGDITIAVGAAADLAGNPIGVPNSATDPGGAVGLGPTVASVQVQPDLSVLVRFDENMGAGVGAAANYTVSGSGLGTLASTPDAAIFFGPDLYRLIWAAGEMRDGGDLDVAVAGVADQVGNPIRMPNSGVDAGGAVGTPPTVASVAVTGLLEVEIAFDEPMGAGALDPANYTLTGSGQGSLAAQPDAVLLLAGSTYRLTWSSGTMLRGGDITLTAGPGAADLAGNPIGAPASATDPAGALAPFTAARYWTIYKR